MISQGDSNVVNEEMWELSFRDLITAYKTLESLEVQTETYVQYSTSVCGYMSIYKQKLHKLCLDIGLFIDKTGCRLSNSKYTLPK